MTKLLAYSLVSVLAGLAIQAYAQTNPSVKFSLDSVQGGWWLSCDDPAVTFFIDGDEYSGDFLGSYKLVLNGDIIVFNNGLVDGHSINVTNDPLSFQIVTANERHLVLRPLPGKPNTDDWNLQSCNDI